ncbi:MAG TPA: BON domain-containing protein [Ktedonobacterales bacterium]
MEYARIECSLVHKGWAPQARVRGMVSGPAFAVAVEPATLAVVATTLAARRLRQLGASASADAAAATVVTLAAGARLVGAHGTLGRVARLWVDRDTLRLRHVLVRPAGARAGTLRVVPAELLTQVAPQRITTSADAKALAALPLYRDDAAILADVRAAIAGVLTDPRARRNVKTHVDDGHVWLAGEVDTRDQVAFVTRAIGHMPGVRAITSDLISQEDLAQAVEARLRAAANGSGSFNGVTTLTEHGIVYLEGNVPTPQARAEVERITLGVAGARVVVNNLRVDGEPPQRNPGTGPLVRNR